MRTEWVRFTYPHRIWEYGFTPHTPAVCEKEILPLLKLLRTVGNR